MRGRHHHVDGDDSFGLYQALREERQLPLGTAMTNPDVTTSPGGVSSGSRPDDPRPALDSGCKHSVIPGQRNDSTNVELPADMMAGIVVPADSPPDPFDLKSLRLPQDFEANVGVKKALITVPVRKPAKEWFIQVHPLEEYRIQAGVVELKEDREMYWVVPSLWPQLISEPTFGYRMLFTSMTRQGDLFIWPVRMPGADGRIDTWNESALEAAQRGQGKWIRVAANMGIGAYDVWESTAVLPPPRWPDTPFQELLRTAFKGKLIDNLDHLALRKLRGEA